MKLTLINEVLEIDNTTQEEFDDIIITDKAIAIKENGIIQLIKIQKEDDNEIIYGI